MSGEAHAVVLRPGEGETLVNALGGSVTFKARAPETGGSMAVMETTVPAGEGPPLHLHANEDELIYVLEGDLQFRLGADLHDAPSGAFVFIPRGLHHTWRNVGDAPARLLIAFTPAGMERFFELFAGRGAPAGDRSAFATTGREVGMQVVGPPLAEE
jgi:quercetin dioxygenase-like cupin family protein